MSDDGVMASPYRSIEMIREGDKAHLRPDSVSSSWVTVMGVCIALWRKSSVQFTGNPGGFVRRVLFSFFLLFRFGLLRGSRQVSRQPSPMTFNFE